MILGVLFLLGVLGGKVFSIPTEMDTLPGSAPTSRARIATAALMDYTQAQRTSNFCGSGAA